MESLKLNIGDTVIYSTTGLCKVNDIVIRTVLGKSREYYVLSPVYQDRSTCFVPVDYDSERIRIEKPLSKEQAEEMLVFITDSSPAKWIAHINDRKLQYSAILRDGSRKEKIQLLKTLYIYRQKLWEQNKRPNSSDEHILNNCREQIFCELAYVLDKPMEEIEELFEQSVFG